MTVQNRTNEFFGAIESLQARGSGAMHAAQLMNRLANNADVKQRLMNDSPHGTRREQRSEFARRSTHIGREISHIGVKLDKLEKRTFDVVFALTLSCQEEELV